MQLPEPQWRRLLAAAVHEAKTTANFRTLDALLAEFTVEHFDDLVQLVFRRQMGEAVLLLKKRYPGSIERQEKIEEELRGGLDQ
jgi:hypothetical protein